MHMTFMYVLCCLRSRSPCATPSYTVNALTHIRSLVFSLSGHAQEGSCALTEGCVSGLGISRLLRFTVSIANQGQADISLPDPSTRPDMYEYSPCHRHYHFRGFAMYALIDSSNNIVLRGHKQAFCLMDSDTMLTGPSVPCLRQHDCKRPGISRGWADNYDSGLDCQVRDSEALKTAVFARTS